MPGFSQGISVANEIGPLTIVLRLTGLGWYVAICIVLGVVGGVFLDKLAGTEPLFILLGIILGSVVAFWGLFKMVQPILNAPKITIRGKDVENPEDKR